MQETQNATWSLAGKTLLVTGAGGGIGSAVARLCAARGASIVVHYRSSADAAQAVAAEIRSHGGSARAVRADLSLADEVDRMFDDLAGDIGPVDAVVNNAGVFPVTPFDRLDAAEWDQVMQANLRSAFLCTQACARQDGDRAARAVVNVASIEGLQPGSRHSHYAASKAAMISLTKSAAMECAPMRVNSVSPGLIGRPGLREQWPEGVARWEAAAALKRVGEPEDVAEAVAFMISPAAAWITGQNLVVDGGVSAGPWF